MSRMREDDEHCLHAARGWMERVWDCENAIIKERPSEEGFFVTFHRAAHLFQLLYNYIIYCYDSILYFAVFM